MRVTLCVFLFLSSALAGCAGSGAETYCLPWPEEGFKATYEVHSAGGGDGRPLNFTWFGQETTLRGDGRTVDAIKITIENTPNYFDIGAGAFIGTDFVVRDFAQNSGLMHWLLLAGMCVDRGDAFRFPYMDGTHAITMTVDAVSPDLVVHGFYPAGTWTPLEGAIPAWEGVFTWRGGDPVPSETRYYPAGQPSEASPRILTGWSGPLGDRPAGIGASPIQFASMAPAGPCQALVQRQPDLSALPVSPSFGDYAGNLSNDERLGSYHEQHPRACAILVSYEVWTEPSSTAYVWTTIYADQTPQNFFHRWVVRCYHEPHLVLMYGECSEHDHYNHEDEDLVGPTEGVSIDPEQVNATVNLKNALETIGRLPMEIPTRFVWRAYDMETPTRSAVVPVLSPIPAPALVFDYGTRWRGVDYLQPGGPEPSGGGQTVAAILSWPNGWMWTVDPSLSVSENPS